MLLHTSNRLEELAEALAIQLQRDPLPPLQNETILLPGPGIARWLRLQLAEHAGIAAGLDLRYPGQFLQGLAAHQAPVAARYTPQVLQFRIQRLLADPKLRPQLGAAAAYCEADQDGRKRFQLSAALAKAFDDYQLYRDDWLQRAATGKLASAGGHEAWQANLWQALWQEDGADPAAMRLPWLRAQLAQPAALAPQLPPRLSLFGISSLPTAVLDLLAVIAQRLPVHLYVLQPTAEFHGERMAGGNSLLQRFGQLAAEFAEQLARLTERPDCRLHHFDLPVLAGRRQQAMPASLLQCLQEDLAGHTERGQPDSELPLFPLAAADHSLLVHECHSPQRELEVVRDQILRLFAHDPALPPHEVMVLVPDISRYAPYAQAVFGAAEGSLPFQVADKDPATALPLCAAVLAMLQLDPARLQVDEVMRLLDQPAVQRRFGLAASETGLLQQLLLQAGVCFGVDAANRAASGELPAFAEHSFAAGLRRLLLGLASGPLQDLVAGSWPVAGELAAHADLLQRALPFLQRLFAVLVQLRQPVRPSEFAALLPQLLADFFVAESASDTKAVDLLQQTASDLLAACATAAHDEPLPAIEWREWLATQLQRAAGSSGFYSGAVTVAAMLPMRMVPVRHLFLCGLDDQSFPRREQPREFDLLQAERRPGDPSLRLGDRQLFLDAVLAARDSLQLTYVGRSLRDDKICAPSIAIGELLDWIDRSCSPAPGDRRPRERVLLQHAMQAWDARYGKNEEPQWFTYRRGRYLPPGDAAAKPFLDLLAATPTSSSARSATTLPELLSFLQNPSRYFLREVLGLRLPTAAGTAPQCEPFAVDGLARYQLLDLAMQRHWQQQDVVAPLAQWLQHTGLLPVGTRGATLALQTAWQIEQVAARLPAGAMPRLHEFRCTVAGVELAGNLPLLGSNYAFYWRPGKLRDIDLVLARTSQLIATLALPAAIGSKPLPMLCAGATELVELPPPAWDAAQRDLATLLQAFQEGQAAPLPFFAGASCAYARAAGKHGPAAALQKALRAFAPAAFGSARSDAEDPYISLCYRDREALATPGFADWALRLAGPALAANEEQP